MDYPIFRLAIAFVLLEVSVVPIGARAVVGVVVVVVIDDGFVASIHVVFWSVCWIMKANK